MLTTVYSSDDISADVRFEAFHEVTERTFAPFRAETADAGHFRGSMAAALLGDEVQAVAASYSQFVALRTLALIRHSDPEMFVIALIKQGRHRFEQAGRQILTRPGSLFVYDTSLPYRMEIPEGEDGPGGALLFQVPKALIPDLAPAAGSWAAAPLPADAGPGALLAQLLRQVCADRSPYKTADADRLGRVAADLLALTLRQRIGAEPTVDPDRRQTLLLGIKAFIEDHLGDPALSPAGIAEANHVSLRYLHRLFELEDATVGSWIRARRLGAALRDLQNPTLRGMPIHRIAARWGFTEPSVFSRTFKTAYGVSPAQARAGSVALIGPGPGPSQRPAPPR